MELQKLASFTRNGQGGNPAGVVLTDALPDAAVMQTVAAEVGFSETVFAAPNATGFRARYFAPQAEVAFCGHATIALGAALGAVHGAGVYQLELNEAEISVTAYEEDGIWGARLVSPGTSYAAPDPGLMEDVLSLFGLTDEDLDPAIPPAMVHGGARHMVIALKHHERLQSMSYDFDTGASLMQAHDLVTINVIWRESEGRIYSRNAFAGHGVYEDPATGAAAAALAGYLRDALGKGAEFEVLQGAEAGHPSRLHVLPQPGQGAPVEVSGTVRHLK